MPEDRAREEPAPEDLATTGLAPGDPAREGPAAAGLGPAGLAAAAAAVAAATAGGGIPGAVLQVGNGDTVLLTVASGVADATPGATRAVTVDTVFDLASLTKVVATLPLVLTLVADGRLTTDTLLGTVLPGCGAAAVTVAQLLSHTAGLPATLIDPAELVGPGPLGSASPLPDADEIRDRLRRVTPLTTPGSAVRYSDVGFLLLGQLCEQAYSAPLDEAFAALVARPTGLARTGFRPLGTCAQPGVAYAATEAVGGRPPKTGLVHDETAEILGGVAGHAGLFGDAADLGRYLSRWWVPGDAPSPPLERGLRAAAITCRTARTGGRRGLGWVLRGDPMDGLHGWPDGAAGHTGFTGTSVAFDAASRFWCVLLTNAVHAGRGLPHIRSLRAAVHGALAPLAAAADRGPATAGRPGPH